MYVPFVNYFKFFPSLFSQALMSKTFYFFLFLQSLFLISWSLLWYVVFFFPPFLHAKLLLLFQHQEYPLKALIIEGLERDIKEIKATHEVRRTFLKIRIKLKDDERRRKKISNGIKEYADIQIRSQMHIYIYIYIYIYMYNRPKRESKLLIDYNNTKSWSKRTCIQKLI